MASHRMLVAAQPAALSALRPLVENGTELVLVHSMEDALRALEQEPAGFQLILSTIAFDDSRMVDFLQAVKRVPALSGIPFLCSRIFSSVLSDDLVLRMGAVCKECGAADFIDIANLAADEARAVMQSAMKACIEGGA